MKGIILSGGLGTRLFPITLGISKQLLPIYDKPMIYYPMSVLMLAGIREILIITTPDDLSNYKKLLGDGNQFGVKIEFIEQPSPEGLAQAFILGEDFISNDNVCLVLGDNVFYGQHFTEMLLRAASRESGATVFGYWVKDPQNYGVVDFDDQGRVVGVEEKPDKPKSHYAITGLYFYDNQVVDIAGSIEPSDRGELEITDVNRVYLQQSQLSVEKISRGFTWLDTGSHDSLLDASNFIENIQKRQGLMVCCPEEIAFSKGWILAEDVAKLAKTLEKNKYGQYLMRLISNL